MRADFEHRSGRTWRLAFAFALAAIVLMSCLVIWSPNFGKIACSLLVVPLSSLMLIIMTARRRGQQLVSTMVIFIAYGLLSWGIIKGSEDVRSDVRWLVGSREWKAKVLAEPAKAAGLKSVIWDGWGMFAQDTDVYLVFSPDDGLRRYSPSNLHGLPCPVWHVQRLEKDWYSVTFYTESDMRDCGY